MRTVEIKGIEIGSGMPKICVPVFGQTREEIVKKAKIAGASQGELVEWRCDFFAQIREEQPLKETLFEMADAIGDKLLLCTFRSKKEGGSAELSPEEYVLMYERILETGKADIIDVELFSGTDVSEKLILSARAQGKKVLLSSHDFSKTPESEEMKKRLRTMEKLGGDIAKIAVMPQNREDVVRLMSAVSEVKKQDMNIPVAAISMGSLGMISRMAGEIYGSDITFAAVTGASAPGQMNISELKKMMDIIHEGIENNS